MNKLTVLYNLMKQMKESDACTGTAAVEAKLDETVLGTLKSEFGCAPGHCEKKMEIHFGEEVLKLEHQGTDKLHGKMCGSHGHHGHHGHGNGCGGPKGKLGKAMFMLKVLDKTELQELADGRKVLTMDLAADDLPSHLQEHLKNKCCGMEKMEHCCGNHEKIQDWMTACGCMDLDCETFKPLSVSVKAILKPDCSPSEMNAVIKAEVSDRNGKPHTITINANGQHA